VSDEIQQNRYDQLLRRVAGIIGPGSKVSQVITELFPMIDVENVPSELLLLAGTRICMGGGTTAGVVGQSGRAQLFNPLGSGALITLTDIFVSGTSTTTVRWGRSNVSFAARITTEVFTDFRNDVGSRPIGQIHQDTSVALATATNQTRILVNVNLHIQPKNDICVLSPGFGFEIGLATQNTAFLFGFNWRERAAQPSELEI